jgi:cell wall-associated NlpC family hydrolase
MTPQDFINAARSMIGVRFHHQGRHPTAGVDCAGLVVCSANKCGVTPGDYNDYQRTPISTDFIEHILKHCDVVQPGDEQPGDLWVFKFANNPQHVAIQTESNPLKMIHAYAPLRKVVEHGIDATWQARRHAVYRPKEQEKWQS